MFVFLDASDCESILTRIAVWPRLQLDRQTSRKQHHHGADPTAIRFILDAGASFSIPQLGDFRECGVDRRASASMISGVRHLVRVYNEA